MRLVHPRFANVLNLLPVCTALVYACLLRSAVLRLPLLPRPHQALIDIVNRADAKVSHGAAGAGTGGGPEMAHGPGLAPSGKGSSELGAGGVR